MTERTKRRLEQIEEAVNPPDKLKQSIIVQFVDADGSVVGEKEFVIGGEMRDQTE